MIAATVKDGRVSAVHTDDPAMRKSHDAPAQVTCAATVRSTKHGIAWAYQYVQAEGGFGHPFFSPPLMKTHIGVIAVELTEAEVDRLRPRSRPTAMAIGIG